MFYFSYNLYYVKWRTGTGFKEIIIVGFILSKQIKSQKEMLDNYKGYIETTDWKKVKEHYEEFIIPSEIAKVEIQVNEQLEKDLDTLTPFVDDTIEKYTEGLRFAIKATMLYMTKRDGQKMVNEVMPKSAHHFEKVWAWIDEHRPDPQENG